ncbi:WAT1-related protein [Sesamum alatum]|uniref:WAT1-related protein n=1 Tax=Sesamum alatum TaxID=300844 RepID=A0AAE2CR76_9LAMI|nr:WAT1-related protein [Sesamum alatum]
MDGRVGVGMIMVQAISTGLQLLSRIILSDGTFVFALMAYRHLVAAFIVLPFALYFERGAVKKVSIAAIFWVFMVALTGISMALGLFYYGLKDTTATYATNFLNLIPVITFLFSTLLRIEALRLHTRAGKMKTLGAMLCLAGALTVTLYKGNSFHLTHFHNHGQKIINKIEKNKTRGTIFLIASCLSAGTWFILQGILATAATFCLISWAITQRGPTYPSMFNPLSLILIAVAEAVFLGEDISVGSLIGMGLIIAGLYSFLWGKSKDTKACTLLPVKESGGAGAGGDAAPESAGLMPSSATIVPATSPD